MSLTYFEGKQIILGTYTQILIQLIFTDNQTPMEFINTLKRLYYNNPRPMALSCL